MEAGIKEFLESSTIHGLVYISTNQRVTRLLWILVVFIGFSGSGYMISESFSAWAISPVSTTIETLPISELDFPNVTVCPPRNSFTSLNPDLVRARNISFGEEKRKELSDFVPEAVYKSNHRAKYLEFLAYRTEKYMDWYRGTSRILLPYQQDGFKQLDLYSSAASGSFSTPFFRQPFDEDTFERQFKSEAHISVPESLEEGSKVVVEVEYDTDHEIGEELSVTTGTMTEELEDTLHHYRAEFDTSQTRIWDHKQNTGLSLTWHLLPLQETEDGFREDNRLFIQLANILHRDQGLSKEVKQLLEDVSLQRRSQTECITGEVSQEVQTLMSGILEDISVEPIYQDDITEESLELAAAVYFDLTFCPDVHLPKVEYYQNLFQNFPLEAILKTLARVLSVAREKNLVENYQTAKALFNKTTEMLGLQYRDVAVMTSRATELQHYQELRDHQVSEDFSQDDLDLTGRRIGELSVPVCHMFQEKVVNGQVCYEAEVNKYKTEANRKDVLVQGLSLIIDTNDEYDVKNLLEKDREEMDEERHSISVYKQHRNEDSFTIMLKTINPVPIVLEGEGDYSLTAVKDVQVTEEFLGLGDGMTKCQTEEYRDDCLTERFSREILSSCDCCPLHLATHLGNKTKTCTPRQLDCLDLVSVDSEECLEHCEGSIADVNRLNNPIDHHALEEILRQYEDFKHPDSGNLTYPSSMKELQFRNKLKFVRISFSTSAFDRIKKDRAAKFVDQLSAIGGTMGLLTGFSLISGVEILYFLAKILVEMIGKNFSTSKDRVCKEQMTA